MILTDPASPRSDRCHVSGVLPSGLVAVGDYGNVLPSEGLGILGSPLAGAAWIASCDESEPAGALTVLFAFTYQN